MRGYQLSRRAAELEIRSAAARGITVEAKSVLSLTHSIEPGRQDGDNFRSNKITLEALNDRGRAHALGLAATWACVNLLAGTIASLPIMVYRTTAEGVRDAARDHPLYRVLHESPNADQTAVDFWEYQCAGLELQGNAFARIDRRSDGAVSALTPIKPADVTVRRIASGELEYEWYDGGRRETVDGGSVLHVRGPLGTALGGASTLSVCRGAFGSAMAADGAAASLFANGVRPSGVLSTADSVSLTAEQRSVLEQLLQEKFQGAMKAGRPMLLDRGMKWTQLDLSPEDAQMLETRRFGVEEICRIFGVPPHMIGHTENSTSWGTGLEQQTLGFVKFSLRRRLKRIEQALEKQLLTARDRVDGITIEFNLEGLLRGDSKGRADFYREMTGMGAMTINEVRRLENMPPVPGGDVPRMQSQNVPITTTEGLE